MMKSFNIHIAVNECSFTVACCPLVCPTCIVSTLVSGDWVNCMRVWSSIFSNFLLSVSSRSIRKFLYTKAAVSLLCISDRFFLHALSTCQVHNNFFGPGPNTSISKQYRTVLHRHSLVLLVHTSQLCSSLPQRN